jgi:hypothetical protein
MFDPLRAALIKATRPARSFSVSCCSTAARSTTRNPNGSAAGPFGTLLDLIAGQYHEPLGRLVEIEAEPQR